VIINHTGTKANNMFVSAINDHRCKSQRKHLEIFHAQKYQPVTRLLGILVIQGVFLLTRCVHGSALRRYQCIMGCEAHMIFADDSACLTADNVWNEGK
jgi:hypothetical protein